MASQLKLPTFFGKSSEEKTQKNSALSVVGEAEEHSNDPTEAKAKNVLAHEAEAKIRIEGVLIGLAGIAKGNNYRMIKDEINIGRAPQNDLILADASTSRFHAQIVYKNGYYWLIDKESSDGTRINGKKINKKALETDDLISIGRCKFRFKALSLKHDSSLNPLIETKQELSPDELKVQNEKKEKEKKESMEVGGANKKAFLKNPVTLIPFVVFVLTAAYFLYSTTQSPSVSSSVKKDYRTFVQKGAKELEPASFIRQVIETKKEESPEIALAENHYQSGMREYLAENYLRARYEFQTAVDVNPRHKDAMTFLTLTKDIIDNKIETHYQRAIHYYYSLQYKRAISEFENIIILLNGRESEKLYQDIMELRRKSFLALGIEKPPPIGVIKGPEND